MITVMKNHFPAASLMLYGQDKLELNGIIFHHPRRIFYAQRLCWCNAASWTREAWQLAEIPMRAAWVASERRNGRSEESAAWLQWDSWRPAGMIRGWSDGDFPDSYV